MIPIDPRPLPGPSNTVDLNAPTRADLAVVAALSGLIAFAIGFWAGVAV